MPAIAGFFRHLLAPQTRMLLTSNGRMSEVLPLLAGSMDP
jgi:hypothetical protein